LIYFYGCDYQGKKPTPPAWELYDLTSDPEELNNVYDDPSYNVIRQQLKSQLAQLRLDIGDDGSHYPECEKVVQEFWDYDQADRNKAIEISGAFRRSREAELERMKKNQK
jgi:N-acetylglucosamine-6-sulfatase